MYITNKDLRIGNVVVYNGKAYQVSDILSSEKIILMGFEEILNTCEIDGFLIDENILVQLGGRKVLKGSLVQYKFEIVDFLTIYFVFSDGKISNSYLFVTQDAETAARFNISIKTEHSDKLISVCL